MTSVNKNQLNKQQLREQKPARDEYLSQPKTPLILVLDNVTNSYNVGSFIRLADAFAVEEVIICGELTMSEKKFNKASRNEAKWVNITFSDSITATLKRLIAEKHTIFSVELCHDSVDYKTLIYPKKTVLVLGNERKGVSEEALNLSHQRTHIPMHGMGNSLNVSTAGAIVLAECASQIRTRSGRS
jgi:tRNA G18 (ribose-2'-O)-methylase SpoU